MFLDRLVDLLGPDAVLAGEAVARFCIDQRQRYRSQALAVAQPSSAEEVATIVKLCREWNIPMVPQGGNTSLCGAATPNEKDNALIISMSRMNQVISIDAINNTITVEAGVTLSKVQEVARITERLFPAHWPAAQICQIGGALATNAGGLNVIHYGNMRELVLGIEVVLPSGEIWDGLRTLRKNNAGYDLKHLFIGSEGTLGIITKAVFRLFPIPVGSATALVALPDLQNALHLLRKIESKLGRCITSFEVISRTCLDLLDRHRSSLSQPLKPIPHWLTSHWAVLLEIEGNSTRKILIQALAQLLSEEKLKDVIVAKTVDEKNELWRLRESIPEAQRLDGVNIKHDISIPVGAVPYFVTRCDTLLNAAIPNVQIVTFGHLGDGSLHYNVLLPKHDQCHTYQYEARINQIVYDTVATFKGSFSAEHGIGQLKRDTLVKYRSPIEITLMRQIKETLDPDNLMNPGKVL